MNFRFTQDDFLLATMKEWLKSALNYRSYLKNKTGYPFFGPPCIVSVILTNAGVILILSIVCLCFFSVR